jgi:cysteine desulfurase
MSTNPRIYLDFNATAPLVDAARAAMVEAMTDLGNPSSIHAEGRRVRHRVEEARNAVAVLVGRPREQIVFTSGGTEANVLGVATLAARVERAGGRRIVVTTPIEHPSLAGAVAALPGWERRMLPVTPTGTVVAAPELLDGASVVAVGLVNHELGTLLPEAILAAARAAGALVHVDAVQAAGKRNLAIDADTIAISAHKLGGPQGIGALIDATVTSSDDDAAPTTGHQERGRRAGTENVLGIVGFGAAARAVDRARWSDVAALGDRLEAGLLALPGTRCHGAGTPRIGGTINVGFAKARGEAIVIALDLAGVAASTGAACTSGTLQPSPVLLALGLSADAAREAVRFSLGPTTTADEIDRVLGLLPSILERARRFA